MLTNHDFYCQCRRCGPVVVGKRRSERYAAIAGTLLIIAALATLLG